MMKFLPLTVVIVAGVAAVFLIERSHVDTQPSPQALLKAAADVQHEVTRIPARFVKLSDRDEIELGKEMASHAYLQPRLSSADTEQNQRIEAYLQQVGDKTAAHARRKLPWTFHYIPDRNFVNAFALPGGQIFVGQGLLLQMHSEDALSAVLGHEIEHADLRHCAQRA